MINTFSRLYRLATTPCEHSEVAEIIRDLIQPSRRRVFPFEFHMKFSQPIRILISGAFNDHAGWYPFEPGNAKVEHLRFYSNLKYCLPRQFRLR